MRVQVPRRLSSCLIYTQPADNVPETPPGALPADVVPYLYPSRYCEADILVRLAQHEFGKLQPGFSRVTAICNWIHDNVEYLRGSTNPHTSAYDTATERAGVCRDFAHQGRLPCIAGSTRTLMVNSLHEFSHRFCRTKQDKSIAETATNCACNRNCSIARRAFIHEVYRGISPLKRLG